MRKLVCCFLLLILAMVGFKENLAGDCDHSVNNCEFSDLGFQCCKPGAETYRAIESNGNPTVVMVDAVPFVGCANVYETDPLTGQCVLPTNATCGGAPISQDCHS